MEYEHILKDVFGREYGIKNFESSGSKQNYIVCATIEITNWPDDTEILTEVREWLGENCIGEWSPGVVITGYCCELWFDNEEDSMAFYLRWL